MAKNIVLSDEVYDMLKAKKGDKSFSVYIGETCGGLGKRGEEMTLLMEKMAKLEKFVSTKSGGQYE